MNVSIPIYIFINLYMRVLIVASPYIIFFFSVQYSTIVYFTVQNLKRTFSLVEIHSLLVLVVKSRVTRCKIRSLLDAEVNSLQKSTRYSLQNSHITHCKSCYLQKITRYTLRNSLFTRCNKSLVTSILFFFIHFAN